MSVSPLVRQHIMLRFKPDETVAADRLIQGAKLPLLDGPAFDRDRERVQLAAIKMASGNLIALASWLELAKKDWRDLLVSAGWADADWPEVARRDGFAV